MVTQQALGPQILRGKATIPWVETRAGAPISEMNEQLGLVRWQLVSQTLRGLYNAPCNGEYRFESCPDYKCILSVMW